MLAVHCTKKTTRSSPTLPYTRYREFFSFRAALQPIVRSLGRLIPLCFLAATRCKADPYQEYNPYRTQENRRRKYVPVDATQAGEKKFTFSLYNTLLFCGMIAACVAFYYLYKIGGSDMIGPAVGAGFGGAVLGFMLLGPPGLVIGAALGVTAVIVSKKKGPSFVASILCCVVGCACLLWALRTKPTKTVGKIARVAGKKVAWGAVAKVAAGVVFMVASLVLGVKSKRDNKRKVVKRDHLAPTLPRQEEQDKDKAPESNVVVPTTKTQELLNTTNSIKDQVKKTTNQLNQPKKKKKKKKKKRKQQQQQQVRARV